LVTSLALTACFKAPPKRPDFFESEGQRAHHKHIDPSLVSNRIPGEGISGGQLYSQNCQVCHGILGSSEKKGRSKANILAAMQRVPEMQSIRLEDKQVQAISDALAEVNDDAVFSCGVDEIIVPAESVKPLSRTQYRNTLNQLFGRYGVMDRIKLDLDSIPVPTDKYNTFDNFNVMLRQGHFDSYWSIARKLSEDLVGNRSFAQDAFGNPACLDAADLSQTCLATFYKDLGLRIYRRPLQASDRSLLERHIGPDMTAREEAKAILATMLLSGDFSYHMQIYGQQPKPSDPGLIELSAYELASRLSYALWESMPDSKLFDLAASGQLKDEAVLSKQIDLMLSDEKARVANARFFTEWLQLKTNVSFTVPEQLLGNIRLEEGLKSDIKTEAESFVNQIVFTQRGGYEDLLKDSSTFAKSPTFQSLLGNPKPEERPGLLWRIVMSGSNFSKERNLIHSGKIIRERLLCDVLPPIPTNLNAQIQEAGSKIQPDRPLREEITQKTEPAQCSGCHIRINPLAFAGANNYDWIGRYISEERRLQSDGSIQAFPVNNRVENPAIDVIREKPLAGPSELASAIAQSQKGPACLIEKRYTAFLGRPASPESMRDGCAMNRAYNALMGSPDGSVIDMLKALLGPEIRYRRLAQSPSN
jgi:hypothetical protein